MPAGPSFGTGRDNMVVPTRSEPHRRDQRTWQNDTSHDDLALVHRTLRSHWRWRAAIIECFVLEEEIDQALGRGSYERAEDRRGYRNGAETRRVTTSVGTRELRVPRARVRDEETGETTEFRSELLPRYARRRWIGRTRAASAHGASGSSFFAESSRTMISGLVSRST